MVNGRRVWVIEVRSRGAGEWRPISGEMFTYEDVANIRLREFAEPHRERFEYQLAAYTPEAQ